MRIAITGANGVLGRAVTELALAQRHTVIAIDRTAATDPIALDGVQRHTADATDYHQLESAVAGAEALVHLAAYITPDAEEGHVVHNNNVVSSYNALSVAEASGIRRVCMASSVNAIGGYYSREPRYDYFPVDEHHPSYAEDPYSLSKWLAEQQAAAFARRYEDMVIASLRLHTLRDRAYMARHNATRPDGGRKELWGYTPVESAARACMAVLTADFSGFEAFYVVAANTSSDLPSIDLRNRYYPRVPVVGDLSGHRSFFNTGKAERLLHWPAS